jgi:hypothetical protein
MDLDERCFTKEKKAFTPSKFTPFAKQGTSNKFSKTDSNSNLNDFAHPTKRPNNSYRILDYDEPAIDSSLKERV